MGESHLDERAFLRVGGLQWLDVLEQLVLVVRFIENGAVDSLSLSREMPHDSGFSRQADDGAPDVLCLECLDGFGDVAGIARRQTSENHDDFTTGVSWDHSEGLKG